MSADPRSADPSSPTPGPTVHPGIHPSPGCELQPGVRIGRWTVLHEVEPENGEPRVRCRCVCGNLAKLVVADLVQGEVPLCELCAKSDAANAARPPSHPPPPAATRAPRPAPLPRRATLRVPAVKVTLPLRPDQLPRDVVPREGGPNVEIELTIEVEGGQRPLSITAVFNSRNYRRAVKAIDEHGGNAMVLIQGRLTGTGELLDAGIAVQAKMGGSPSAREA